MLSVDQLSLKKQPKCFEEEIVSARVLCHKINFDFAKNKDRKFIY